MRIPCESSATATVEPPRARARGYGCRRRASPGFPSLAAGLLACLLGAFHTAAWAAEQRVDESARQALTVTIYGDDLALIRERRQIGLEAGESRLAWQPVARQIRAETVMVREASGVLPVRLLAQTFEAPVSAEGLLAAYIGRQVQVIRTTDAGERTVETARILAAHDGVVLRYADRIETQVIGHIAYPEMPEGLRARPTLALQVAAGSAGTGVLELAYLTRGLDWQADYVANLAADGASLDLDGWASLRNESGMAYPEAQVQLIAGEVHQVRETGQRPIASRRLTVANAQTAPKREVLDEYHVYSLPDTLDIPDRQTKQVLLLSVPDIPVDRELVVAGQNQPYRSGGSTGWQPVPVESRLHFVNPAGAQSAPLPGGVIRVYTEDGCGQAQFLGEGTIAHTPRAQEARLQLGESFDVTARRKQTDFRKLAGTSAHDYVYEAAFVIEIRNAKRQRARVRVIETLPGDWEILDENLPHTKEAANSVAWTLDVPKEATQTLSWRARVRH